MADKAPYTYLGGFSFLWVLQVKKSRRADSNR
jgi:hypothetical protein